MRLVIDMNLSPSWVFALADHGWDAVHWSEVGDPGASDRQIMVWALEHDRVVLTHDLDFGTVLALTQSEGPSVIQVRTQDPSPDNLRHIVAAVLERHQHALESGALITVDERRSRVRLLPLSGG